MKEICFKISIPSKTFLLGEYGVLNGGSALLVGTQPRFVFDVSPIENESICKGIHPSSPAGQWIRKNKSAFENIQVNFNDPYEGEGGFGASSAQFLGAYIWSLMNQSDLVSTLKDLSGENVVKAFWELMESDLNLVKPSGSDLISQWNGGICEYNKEHLKSLNYTWNFEDLSFSIFKTKVKVNTHQHLEELKDINYDILKQISFDAINSFKSKDSHNFVKLVKDFYYQLKENKLVHNDIEMIIENLLKNDFVLSAKGCGALGADVVIVFHRPGFEKQVMSLAESLSLRWISDVSRLSEGVKVESYLRNKEIVKRDSIHSNQFLTSEI